MRCRKGLRARFTIQSTPQPPFVIECSHLHVPNPGESCIHTHTHAHLHNLLHVDERGAHRGQFSAFPRDVCAVLPNVEEFPHSRAHAVTSRSRVFGGSNPSTLVILGEIPRTHSSEVMSSESEWGAWGGLLECSQFTQNHVFCVLFIHLLGSRSLSSSSSGSSLKPVSLSLS